MSQVDPTSLFCVLPASPEELSLLAAGANSLGLAVLGALIGFLAVVLIAITIVATYKNCICERVRYTFTLYCQLSAFMVIIREN